MATVVAQAPLEAAPPPEPPAELLPPGPRLPATVVTLLWAVAPTWVMDRCAERLGDAFTLTFAPSGRKIVILSDPEAVKAVFTAPAEAAPSAAGSSPIAPIMGPSSVITLTGPEHLRQRRLLLPPFHGERMREYEQVIVQATRSSMAAWPLDRPMRLDKRTRGITLEVILRAVFGVEAERMELLRDAITDLLEPVHMPVLVLFALRRPSLERPKGAIGRALDRLDAIIYQEIARRRAQPDLAERADILSLLLLAHDEDGEAMTDGELRDELVTLLLAGHETTATAVAWAVERLVRHPDKLARLVAEIDAGESDEYMQAVINETLRVRPVVPLVVRLLREPMQLGSRALPAGARVAPSIYLTNRNPRVYESPQEFKPERFLGRAPETFSWIPFGGGIRRCLGATLAMAEQRVVLEAMARRLDLEAVEPEPERALHRNVTMIPARGARAILRSRLP